MHGHGIEQDMSTTSSAIRLFLFRLVVPTAMILKNPEDTKGGRGKEEEEGVREESAQVHGHGIEQNMSTTSFAICLFLFRLVVPTAMILNKSRRR